MTVNNSRSRVVFAGDGGRTQWTFDFIGVASAYLTVLYTDRTGVQTQLTEGTGPDQYQMVLAEPVEGAVWGLGGTVTYAPHGNPIPLGSFLTVVRVLPETQPVSLINQGSVQILGHGAETAVDRAVMLIQQDADRLARAIVANPGNANPPQPLPPAAQIKGLPLYADPATGESIIAGLTANPAGIISSVMQPVVGAPSIQTAQDLLGISQLIADWNDLSEELGTGINNLVDALNAINTRIDALAGSVAGQTHTQEFRQSGTYVPTGTALWVVAEGMGAGGGGGNAEALGGETTGGGGGGSGGYFNIILTQAQIAAAGTIPIAIGFGGANQQPGGATSVGSFVTANGGAGGQPNDNTRNFGAGGVGGTVTVAAGVMGYTSVGDAGGTGSTMVSLAGTTTGISGRGGDILGGSAQEATASGVGTSSGNPGVNGAGGSGGVAASGGGTGVGGRGGDGWVVFTEFLPPTFAAAALMSPFALRRRL